MGQTRTTTMAWWTLAVLLVGQLDAQHVVPLAKAPPLAPLRTVDRQTPPRQPDQGRSLRGLHKANNAKKAADGLPASFREASQPQARGKSGSNGKAFGYQTAVGYGTAQGLALAGASAAADFNPLLAGGRRGGPGLKARVNARGFQYASTIIAPILDQQIKQARIPPITQNIPEVNGCIQVYNLYVSRYRCPQRVVIYPAPPDQIVLAVQNVDVGVTGNLAGKINILIPIPISGIIEVNVHQASITVALVVVRTAAGGVALRVASCQATIGYLDAYIVNGGLIGDIANSQFRGRISNQIRSMLPGQLCARLPDLLNTEVNSKLAALPQSVALTQLLGVAGSALGLGDVLGGGGQCASACGASSGGGAYAVPPLSSANAYATAPQLYAAPKAQALPLAPPREHNGSSLISASSASKQIQRAHAAGVSAVQAARPLPRPEPAGDSRVRQRFVRSAAPTAKLPKAANRTGRVRAHGVGPVPYGQSAVLFADPNECGGCPNSGGQGQLGFLMTVVRSLDMSKLSQLALTTQFLQAYATNYDYTLELNGEFSPGGQGGTPFGPFPMQFPQPVGTKMAEVLVSDYTVNSLFYWLHRTGFLSFRLGPETPKIGELLRTTCADDAEDVLEDHGVEVDEELAKRRRRQSRHALTTKAGVVLLNRHKRQDTSLTDLGICFGDVLPAVRERYPNQRIVVQIRTRQAPSLLLSQRNGGTASLDLVADAEIFIESTNERVGAITITAAADIIVSTAGGRLTGQAIITRLQLNDFAGTLGLPQDALDNLATLGKEVIQKAANDALQKGIALSPPNGIGGLPVTFVAPEVRVVEHAVHLAADFTVDPAGLQRLLGAQGGIGGGTCRR